MENQLPLLMVHQLLYLFTVLLGKKDLTQMD